MISFLKEEEARLNLARVNKAGEYQIEQIEGKITNRSNRIKSLSREREQIRYESIEAQKDVKRTKESAKEDFIRLKRRLERKLHEKNFPSMSHRNSTYSSPLKDQSSTRNTARSIASPDPRESFIFEYSPHKKRASTPLTEPTTSSTPIKSSRTTSLSHNRVMSGVCGSSILYEIILEEESKAAMQSNNTSKRQRRSRAQRGSMPNPYINIIDLSNVFKGEIELSN